MKGERKMSRVLNCTNCCIWDFKDSLCDCDNGICKEFKKIGTAEDFENDVLNRINTKVEWIPITTSEPTTSDHVLVTYNWGDDDYDDYEVSELDYWVTKCAAEEGNKQCQMFIDHVIAWSFMPQPYREREKERNV